MFLYGGSTRSLANTWFIGPEGLFSEVREVSSFTSFSGPVFLNSVLCNIAAIDHVLLTGFRESWINKLLKSVKKGVSVYVAEIVKKVYY